MKPDDEKSEDENQEQPNGIGDSGDEDGELDEEDDSYGQDQKPEKVGRGSETGDEERNGSDQGLVSRMRKTSIRTSMSSLLLKFGFLFLVMVLIVVAVAYGLQTQSSKVVREDVEDKLTVQARTEADRITEWINRNKIPARIISDDVVFRNETRVGRFLSNQIDNMQLGDEDVLQIHWIDLEKRRIIESTNRTLEGKSFVDSPWNPKTFSFNSFDDVTVSDPYTNFRGNGAIAFMSPVRERPNTVVVLEVGVGEVQDRFRETVGGSFTQVVDSEGRIIFASNSEKVLDPYLTNLELTPKVIRNRINRSSGFLEEDLKEKEIGEDLVFAYSSVEGTDWVLVKHTPADKAYKVESNINTMIVAFVAIILAGIVLVGVIIEKNVASPIRELSEKTGRMEKGEYGVDLDSGREDEIGDLYSSFDSMRDALRERIIEAEDAMRRAEEAKKDLERAYEAVEEQKVIISVLNRVLRHNLRNSMNVILGRSGLIEEDTSDEEVKKHVEMIKQETRDLIQKAEKAKGIERIVEENEWGMETVDISRLAEEEVKKKRQKYPEARIETEIPENILVRGYEAIGIAISIFVDNAVVHSDRSPEVHVSVLPNQDQARDQGRDQESKKAKNRVEVRIEDNGPGIPQTEIDVLDERHETQLRHGSGFGLWVSKWIVDRVEGELIFEENEPRGTVVRVLLKPVEDVDEETDAESEFEENKKENGIEGEED